MRKLLLVHPMLVIATKATSLGERYSANEIQRLVPKTPNRFPEKLCHLISPRMKRNFLHDNPVYEFCPVLVFLKSNHPSKFQDESRIALSTTSTSANVFDLEPAYTNLSTSLGSPIMQHWILADSHYQAWCKSPTLTSTPSLIGCAILLC
ncbi:hypothetical protein TIFTF001_037941 [Ficus carica]|uniref:Uncharacterized protein n=1 Tax=Ficus carica TaxID=3494 RepID=A0AA88E9N6_FICCA|nr:hypothetical protein TIFTF001_037941 [Ficus carica]